jgi:hypothetical protein
MDGDNDESEKKLLKEFCNVSRNNCFKKGKKITDRFYSRSRTKEQTPDSFFPFISL